jgi:Zn-dependent protease with chaperone function
MAGFALVFVVLVVALSALASTVLAACDGALRRRGPHAERRAVVLAALAPVALAAAVLAALVGHSLLATDHCLAHDHHAHLCVAHGGAWLERPWVVAVLALALAGVAARLAVLGARVARASASIARLRRLSVPAGDVRLVDSPHAFCFVAGLRRPSIYASTTAWHGLADDERAAMIAHERGHVVHRDVGRRFALDLVLALAAPLAGGPLARRWSHATERLRDADAAAALGDPDPVARALLHVCRLERGVARPGLGFTARGRLLADRIEALLSAAPDGRPAARHLSIVVLVGLGGLVVLAAGLAGPLHHAFETLLG